MLMSHDIFYPYPVASNTGNHYFKSLPNNKILVESKLKAVADKLNCTQTIFFPCEMTAEKVKMFSKALNISILFSPQICHMLKELIMANYLIPLETREAFDRSDTALPIEAIPSP